MGTLVEQDAARIFRQMVESVVYCNKRGFYHRDLTARSFMFLARDINSPVILVELGLSRMIKGIFFN